VYQNIFILVDNKQAGVQSEDDQTYAHDLCVTYFFLHGNRLNAPIDLKIKLPLHFNGRFRLKKNA